MKPETRARTSTEATASKRPENSSHCVTRLATGGATSTCVAGGPPWARAAVDVTRRAKPAVASRRRQTDNNDFPRILGGGGADVVVQRGTFNCLAGNHRLGEANDLLVVRMNHLLHPGSPHASNANSL